MQPLNLALGLEIFDHMIHRGVPYGLGQKAPSLTCDSELIHSIDCSGFSRYLIGRMFYSKYKGTLDFPDGSQQQLAYCEKNLLSSKTSYTIPVPGGLKIAFMKPLPGGHGHVWFITDDGFTMESHGGRGVNARHYKTPILMRRVCACFSLPVVRV